MSYSDMPEVLLAFVIVCQEPDNQVSQRQAEKAPLNMQRVLGFASPRPLAPPKVPETALAWTVGGYTGPEPMNLSAGKRTISVEETVKRFPDGRCFQCGEFNHRVAECAAREKAHRLKATGAEVKEVGTGTGSEGSGKDLVN